MKTNFKIIKKLERFTIDAEYGFDQGTLVIQGESGAGKTTLINCIAGLAVPDAGEVIIDGVTLFRRTGSVSDIEAGKKSKAEINIPVRSRNIGYVFQHYVLFPNMTVGENISYGIRNKAEHHDKSMLRELVEYSAYIMETFGISHLKERRPGEISGGEKQRVALARAIVTRPKLLLLDEPFSALDQDTKEVVYDEFLMLKRDFMIPTILITHNEEESRMFGDFVIRMKDGRVLS